MGEHLVRLAAEQNVAEAAPAVRGHEDEVAAGLGGGLDDAFVRDVAGQRDACVRDAFLAAQFFGLGEDFGGLLFGEFGELLGRGGVDQCAFAVIDDRVAGLGVEGGQIGIQGITVTQ